MIAQTPSRPGKHRAKPISRARTLIPARIAALPDRTIEFVPNPLFAEPDATRRIEQLRPDASESAGRPSEETSDLPALYRAPLLSPAEERYLFCRMNFEKCQAEALRKKLRRFPGSPVLAEAVEDHLAVALELRNRIVAANVRLVAAAARSFREPGVSLEELVSAGQLPLIRAVELFDVSRGLCFSTYASNAVRNHFLRLRTQRARRRKLQVPGDPDLLSEAPDPRQDLVGAEARERHHKRLVKRLLDGLSPRELAILTSRFGLEGEHDGRTFQEIADELGLSKERVRVITHRTLEQLQDRAREERLELDE